VIYKIHLKTSNWHEVTECNVSQRLSVAHAGISHSAAFLQAKSTTAKFLVLQVVKD